MIKFEITSKNYKLKDTGIVLIEVLDFNKKDMTLGTGKNALRFAGNNLKSRSLCSVPLQVSLSSDLQFLITPLWHHQTFFHDKTFIFFGFLIFWRGPS